MTKFIPKIGLCNYLRKNICIGSHKYKNKPRIPKGIIHIQASFNNTIVTVTDVRGWTFSWFSAGASGFRSIRKGTPYAAQVAALNIIRTTVGRGMKQAKVMIKGTG